MAQMRPESNRLSLALEIAEALGKERMMIFDAMVSAVLEDPRSRAAKEALLTGPAVRSDSLVSGGYSNQRCAFRTARLIIGLRDL